MVAVGWEGREGTRGLVLLGLVSLLGGPSKRTAMGTGRAWGTVKSGGSFYNAFLRFSLFESEGCSLIFFFLLLLLFPPLAPRLCSFPSPALHWDVDISCMGVVVPPLIAAFVTRVHWQAPGSPAGALQADAGWGEAAHPSWG